MRFNRNKQKTDKDDKEIEPEKNLNFMNAFLCLSTEMV